MLKWILSNRTNKKNTHNVRPKLNNADTFLENKNKYSLSLNNFKTDKEYFIRVRRSLGNYENSFIIKDCKNLSFIVMSDSQGMTKEDYDIFIKVFQKIYEKFDFKFVAHLGDFVDDGSNENYWDFILNSPRKIEININTFWTKIFINFK